MTTGLSQFSSQGECDMGRVNYDDHSLAGALLPLRSPSFCVISGAWMGGGIGESAGLSRRRTWYRSAAWTGARRPQKRRLGRAVSAASFGALRDDWRREAQRKGGENAVGLEGRA